jgi:glycine cleavage system H protein
MVRKDLRYTQEHEWVRIEAADLSTRCARSDSGEVAVIGITDYAQKALGDITYVELPRVGTKLQRGKEFAVVESAKAASDVFAPASGTVAEVNSSLADHPELINQDPYGEGWLVRVTGVSAEEVASLLSPEEYEKLIATEESG